MTRDLFHHLLEANRGHRRVCFASEHRIQIGIVARSETDETNLAVQVVAGRIQHSLLHRRHHSHDVESSSPVVGLNEVGVLGGHLSSSDA